MQKYDYFVNRDYKNQQKINGVLSELPRFCGDFVIGIESRTSVLTRLNYCYDIRTFFRYCINYYEKFNGNKTSEFTLKDLDTFTSIDFEKYISNLSYYETERGVFKNNERAKARKLSALRSLYNYLYRKNFITTNEILKVDMPKIHEKEIIHLEANEVVKVLDEIENPINFTDRQKSYMKNTTLRDLAICTLLLGTGIRISECVGLNIDDIDFDINGFVVTRKGGAREILYFSEEVEDSLRKYIKQRLLLKNIDQQEQALFLSLQRKRIGVRAVENIVKKYSKSAVPLKNISPHKFRSTYGTNLYRETQDIYVVANVLGHKDINTTRKHYAAMSEDLRRKAIDKVKLR